MGWQVLTETNKQEIEYALYPQQQKNEINKKWQTHYPVRNGICQIWNDSIFVVTTQWQQHFTELPNLQS